MTLPWVRLDASIASNPKIAKLCAENRHRAVNVYVFGICYAGHHVTDGYVPAAVLPLIHGRAVEARQLVDAGLWIPSGDGWLIHGWSEYQPTKETVEARSDQSRRAICSRWMRKGRPCTCGEHKGLRIAE